jgi:putative zinc finger/helix-turn-helix YgiT family protein
MRGICPNCEKETDLELVHAAENIEVRGEQIKIDMEYYRCLSCGEEFEDPRSDDDPLDKAYREYRRRHGMIQPEEIRNLRKRYGFTQHEMSKLLGWGLATLSRYENGALQDEAHDKTLRLAMEPRNVLKLVEETSNALSEERKEEMTAQLRASEEEVYSLGRIYEERFGRYQADELSGYRNLNLAKLVNAILFFCKDGVLKTVLNKLLFYADFKHYKEYATSITGARYARVPFGPAPDKWQHYFSMLIEENALSSDEIFYNEEISGEKFTSKKMPELTCFKNTELLMLATVKEQFKRWPAKRISDFSHNEKGYKETPNGHLISYEYAEELQI